MTFFEAIRTVLVKYFAFKGRASRSEYWFWILFISLYWLISIIIIDSRLPDFIPDPILILTQLALFIPTTAVGVRRLHDTGRSGSRFFWPFGALILLIGVFWLILFTVGGELWHLALLIPFVIGFFASVALNLFWLSLPGDRETNRYGESAKSIREIRNTSLEETNKSNNFFSNTLSLWMAFGIVFILGIFFVITIVGL
ncbi:MAG: DUF805 domain-containing protein [Chloroflexota bacterium]|nr:DUF805 domain-containing protein [Chloroflexota bacterium]